MHPLLSCLLLLLLLPPLYAPIVVPIFLIFVHVRAPGFATPEAAGEEVVTSSAALVIIIIIIPTGFLLLVLASFCVFAIFNLVLGLKLFCGLENPIGIELRFAMWY
jgi:hypothetical protein